MHACVMEWIAEALENATLRSFTDDGDRHAQLEQAATVASGVAVGAGASALVMMCVILSSKVNARCRNEPPPRPPPSPPVKSEIECENTEGAYRSDSEADDEGEQRRVTKAAQRLSRSEGRV